LEYLRRGYFSHIQLYTYSCEDQKMLTKLNFEEDLLSKIEIIGPSKKARNTLDHLRHSLDYNKIRAALNNGAVISKTNQINGCWTALIAKAFGCKMFLRCGYILSRRLFKNRSYLSGIIASIIEVISFNISDLTSVTTEDARAYVSHYTLRGRKKIFVAPTYVNTEVFNAKITQQCDTSDVIYVGRLEKQKNVLSLIKACKLAACRLTIVGKGSLQDEVFALSESLGVQIKHFPSLQNEEIANLFRKHKYFVLPSLHEGLPKVLIEAMAAEMICIGTPTSGITDLIKAEETGFLAEGFNPEDIAEAILSAQTDPMAGKYAQNARQWVLDHHSISSYVENEYSKILALLSS
ncbi:glycosyltransferase family 4 protein, partial [Nitrosomonas sp.]|uniref:glycosyltransferase family 4 protein n=1 Tax=Nitrosomonas sp. TaxID=42353 RepID=UPI001D3EC959